MDHGIFLVQTFRCIIENNLDENGFINDNEKIQNILKDNIFGIDINDESIDVTIFSLYLTILDYKNPRTLQGFKFPNIKNSNLFIYDFFDNKVTKILEKIQFDVIIGNPPWGSVDGKHLEYCIKNNYPNAQKEISRSFIYRVKEFCSTKTKCCLVLPSKLLYNSQKPAAEFRKVLLENTKIEKIIELSTVRNLLFKNAKAPSIILVFNIDNTDYLENEIEHICFKPNIFFEYFNIIALERNDIKFIPQIFLRDNDWAWKVLLYGTIYDVEIIKRIRKSYKTLQDIINEYKLIAKSGISAGEGKKDSRHFIGKKILDARQDMDSFFINYDNMKKFNKISIYRVATKEQFVPPYCIIKKGLDVNTYRMRAAYSEKEFLYTNGIYAIKGERKDTDILLNITGLINSSLYAYLNFMLGTSAGIEREQGFFKEIKTFPYVYSEEIKKKVKEIQKEKQLKWNFKRASNEKQLIKELDDNLKYFHSLILKDYNVDININGSGAAGGIGGGSYFFLKASLKKGIDTILKLINFKKLLIGCDFIFTGEGRIDFQSFNGKVISGILKNAKIMNIPVIALTGSVNKNIDFKNDLNTIFTINRGIESLNEALLNAKDNYRLTIRNILKLIKIAEKKSI